MQKIVLVKTKKQKNTRKNLFLLNAVCASFLLSACVGTSTPFTAANTATPQKQNTIQINERLVFMQAEIAFQRSNFDVAFQKFQLLEAARPEDLNVTRRLLQIASRNNQLNDVHHYAQKTTQLDPEDVQAWQSLAEVSWFRRDYPATLAACEQILRLQPDNPLQATEQVLGVLRQAHSNQQSQITQMLTELSEKFDQNTELLLADGRIRQENGDYRQSQQRAQQILKQEPVQLEAHRLLVGSLVSQGQLPQADAAFERLLVSFEARQVQTKQNSIQNLDNFELMTQNLRLGYVAMLIDANHFEHAKNQLYALTKTYPKNIQALRALALLHLQTNDYAKAEQLFEKLTQNAQESDMAWYYLGNSAYEQAQYAKAIQYYQKVQGGEYLLDAHTRTAYAYGKQHLTAQGAEVLEKCLTNFPEHYVDITTSLSDFWRDFGRMDQAFVVLNQAIERNDSDGLRYARALLHEKSQNMPAAQADLRTIVARNKDHFSALNALGYLLSNSDPQYYAEAEQLITRALQLNPEESAILDSRGWIEYRLGRLDNALFYLRRAYKKAPLPEIAAHLGEVLYQMGETNEAKHILVEASERDSKNPSPDPTLSDAMSRFVK